MSSLESDNTFWALLISSFVYLFSVAHLRRTLPHNGPKLKAQLKHLPLVYYGFFFGCYATFAAALLLSTTLGLDTLRCADAPPASDASAETGAQGSCSTVQPLLSFRHQLPQYVASAMLALAPLHHADTLFLLLNQPDELTTAHLLERLLVPFRLYFDLRLHPYGFGLLFALCHSLLCCVRYLLLAWRQLRSLQLELPAGAAGAAASLAKLAAQRTEMLRYWIRGQSELLALLQLLCNSFLLLQSLHALQSGCAVALGLRQLHALFALFMFMSAWGDFKRRFSAVRPTQPQPPLAPAARAAVVRPTHTAGHSNSTNHNCTSERNRNLVKSAANGSANGPAQVSIYQPICSDIHHRLG